MDAIDNAKLLVFEAEKQNLVSTDYRKECMEFLESADLDDANDVARLQEILETVETSKPDMVSDTTKSILESAENGEITEEEKELLLAIL